MRKICILYSADLHFIDHLDLRIFFRHLNCCPWYTSIQFHKGKTRKHPKDPTMRYKYMNIVESEEKEERERELLSWKNS